MLPVHCSHGVQQDAPAQASSLGLSTQSIAAYGHAPWLELSWLTRASEGDAGCGAEPVLPEAVGGPKVHQIGGAGRALQPFGGAAKALSPVVPFCTDIHGKRRMSFCLPILRLCTQ